MLDAAPLNSLEPPARASNLPALIDRATATLVNAGTSAEVLEARELAGAAYDIAKRTGRLLRAKQAHDELVAAAYRAQGDALLIESQAKMRLADEYDTAQRAGQIARKGRPKNPGNAGIIPVAADAGLTTQQTCDTRRLREAVRATAGGSAACKNPFITGDGSVFHRESIAIMATPPGCGDDRSGPPATIADLVFFAFVVIVPIPSTLDQGLGAR